MTKKVPICLVLKNNYIELNRNERYFNLKNLLFFDNY